MIIRSLLALQLLSCAVFVVPVSIPARAEAPATTSEYDAAIIRDYTARGYFINGQLGEMIDSGLDGLEGPVFPGFDPADEYAAYLYQYAAQLNRALDKLPAHGTPGKTVVYRGIHTSNSKETPEARFFKGRVWKERRYTSSTTDREVAKRFAMGAFKNEGCGGCPAHVEKPNPRNAVILSIVSLTGKEITRFAADQGEKEVLFKSGTIFKVVEAGRDERRRYLVRIVELDPANLSAADAKALAESEAKYLSTRREELAKDGVSLDGVAGKWNEAHRRWRAEGLLEKPIDFEYWAEGG